MVASEVKLNESMKEKIQKLSIKGLVLQKGKFLILKDKTGRWELPGGRIEFGESLDQTLRREFKEELGAVDVKAGNPIGSFEFTFVSGNNNYQFIILVLECQAEIDEIKLSDEHTEYQWISPKKVRFYPMRDGYIEIIEKYFSNQK